MFVFAPNEEKRFHLETGESLILFTYQKSSTGHGYWSSLGWHDDEYGEWDTD